MNKKLGSDMAQKSFEHPLEWFTNVVQTMKLKPNLNTFPEKNWEPHEPKNQLQGNGNKVPSAFFIFLKSMKKS